MIQIEDNDLPITVAQKIITGTKTCIRSAAQKAAYKVFSGSDEIDDTCDMFSLEEIEEIAIYLRAYCNTHSDGD